MIDIKTLKQYPLSFRLLEQWVEQKHTTSLALLFDKVTNEDLVEFLDGNKVMIESFAVDAWDNWMWRIVLEDLMSPFFVACQDENEYISRVLSTEAAITKAFELLEQKLKVN